jgi:hypothetical protein
MTYRQGRPSRRVLILAGLGAATALLAACTTTVDQTPTPIPEAPTPPVPTVEPSASPRATASPPPAASPTSRPRIYLPELSQTLPTPVPPSPTPRPATSTPIPQPTATPGPPRPTDTPRPTQPPAPTPGPPIPILKKTKWGLGVYREGNEVFNDLYVAKPTVILLQDPSVGWAKRVKETFPNAFVVGRRYKAEDDQPLDNPGPRGTALADWVAELAIPLRGVVDAWVSYNEVLGADYSEDYKRYNEFQVAFANRLQKVHGVDAVAANDGSAAVEPEEYPRYFADAIRASKYFGVHAYSALGSHRMRGDDADWHALRYRKIHNELERAGIGGVRMVMTESGLGDGWLHRVDDVIMADEFFWFTDELEKDPYVIGHAAYGLFGSLDARWKAFEMKGTDILTRMGYYEPPPRRPRTP